MMRLFVNLATTLVLVLLIAGPSVFSANLVEFASSEGIVIYNKSAKFGKLLKLADLPNNNFNLEFKVFSQSQALYSGILEVENDKDVVTVVEITNEHPRWEIFFDTGGQIFGPKTVKLLPRQSVGINLLAPPSHNLKETTSFSLKLN